jgi:hypothetical protein
MFPLVPGPLPPGSPKSVIFLCRPMVSVFVVGFLFLPSRTLNMAQCVDWVARTYARTRACTHARTLHCPTAHIISLMSHTLHCSTTHVHCAHVMYVLLPDGNTRQASSRSLRRRSSLLREEESQWKALSCLPRPRHWSSRRLSRSLHVSSCPARAHARTHSLVSLTLSLSRIFTNTLSHSHARAHKHTHTYTHKHTHTHSHTYTHARARAVFTIFRSSSRHPRARGSTGVWDLRELCDEGVQDALRTDGL